MSTDELSRSIASAVSRAVERAVDQALSSISSLPSQSSRGQGHENPRVNSVATAQEVFMTNSVGGCVVVLTLCALSIDTYMFYPVSLACLAASLVKWTVC